MKRILIGTVIDSIAAKPQPNNKKHLFHFINMVAARYQLPASTI